MDFVTHLLIAAILGKVFFVSSSSIWLMMLGSVIPDISIWPLYIYYGGFRRAKDNFFANKKPEPRGLFGFYDFSHSIILLLLVLAISLWWRDAIYIFWGLLAHVLIDLPLHKKHAVGIFFPWRFRIPGRWEWTQLTYAFKYRLLIWAVLGGVLIFLFLI